MDIEAQLTAAKAAHQAGDLAAAENQYLAIIQGGAQNADTYFLLGTVKQQQGRGDEAFQLMELALGLDAAHTGALTGAGQLFMANGRAGEALEKFDRVTALEPEVARAWFNRGIALAALRQFEDAVSAYDKALALEPMSVPALVSRGLALVNLQRFGDALADYERALVLQPGDAGIYYHRGGALDGMGRPDDAVASFDAALRLAPNFFAAIESRGGVLLKLDRLDEALRSFDAALAIAPNNGAAWANRASALYTLKRYDEALASCNRAIALVPNRAGPHAVRGLALRRLHRYDEALASYDRALLIDPGHAITWNHRGVLLMDMNRFEEAEHSHSRALALWPDFTNALHDRGYLLARRLDQYEAGVADLERAAALSPPYDFTRGDLMHVRMHAGDWRNFDAEKARIDEGVRQGYFTVHPFAYQAISDSPADLAACSRRFAGFFPAAADAPAHPPARAAGKIRIGYLGADFRDQATSYLMAGVYEAHDRDRFEIVAFDNGHDDDSALRRRLEGAFDHWVDISGLSDTQAAAKIRSQGIDILVSLSGYFAGFRMGVFAQKPAPIQVNYLGFPATLGAPYIDYLIADATVIPDDERQHYSEAVVWLPDSYQANDAKRPIADSAVTRAQCGLADDAFVFCNFNQSYKFTPATFVGWMLILKAVPGSVLWLLDHGSVFRENLTREAIDAGIAPERLVFAERLAVDAHLARLALADLFLDSLPYNAHTTASDALWAGLPLLTCRGSAFAGRVAASLLAAAGLPELITENAEDYEREAIALAREPKRLAAIREKLAGQRDTSALFDTATFTRHLEAAYRTMQERRTRNEPPRHFAITRE